MVKEKAYAKINLFLDVVGKRADDFHDLEMVMAPIDLYDVLTFERLSEDKIALTNDKEITKNPEDNLVYKVAEQVKKAYNIDSGINIHIQKNIPIAAGLGGGSADAAATLRGLNKLFKLKLSNEKMAEIGETFGADVPYCVYNKLCIARGKGEQLFFLKTKIKRPILIITPPTRVSTKKVYQSIDMNKYVKRRITAMTNAIYNNNYELITRELFNGLEPYTFELFPEVSKLKNEIETYNPDGVLMSGSGPSIFVFHSDRQALVEMEKKFSDNHFAILTKTK